MRKCVLLAFVLPGALGIVAQAADDRAPRTLMIADFEDDTVLGQISTSGVSVALTEQDAVSGRHALEVRVRPFSVHNNHWTLSIFVPIRR